MTALDQAIIKAYLRHGGTPAADNVEPSEPAGAEVAAEKTEPVTQPESKPARIQRRDVAESRPRAVPFDSLDFVGTSLSNDVAQAIVHASTVAEASPAALDAQPSHSIDRSADSSGTAPRPANRSFEPQLRIDTISWPRPSRRLRRIASGQIERLAEAVRAAASSGKKIVGVVGFSHGEGCTTVLLAIASRLVEQGMGTLLLDGDVVQPKLLQQLALENDRGWRDVVAGRIPLEETVTECDSASLAVLPYRGRETPRDSLEPSRQDIAALVDRIRSRYEIILVDMGATLTCHDGDATLAKELALQIDSALVVQNVRTTSPDHLNLLRRRLQVLGIQETGIVENFVEDISV